VLKRRDAPPTPPQDLAAAARVCTARRWLVQNIIDRTRGANTDSMYDLHSVHPLDLLLVDPANLSDVFPSRTSSMLELSTKIMYSQLKLLHL
jgi:hypothetical protein